MRVVVDPPLDSWRLQRPAHGKPIIATGHQAWLWHPGILAKDIAMRVAAERLDAGTLHLIVDHDVHDATTLELPVLHGDQLGVETVRLGHQVADVPTGFQPPLDPQAMRQALVEARDRLGTALLADLDPLLTAIDHLPPQPNLARQMAALTAELMKPYAGEPVLLEATRLLDDARELVEQRLLPDARRAIRCYNRAVADHPQAGVSRLIEDRERVELPLWLVRWQRPRQRIFADLADSRSPLLTEEDGTPIEQDATLAPRALMLTAIARRRYQAFIHGVGGGVYDRAMEQWWGDWTGDPPTALAPMAVVTADVQLELDAPVATPDELTRAVWYRYHLPHNVDRMLDVNGSLVRQKHELLEHMDDDRDPRRRSAAFGQIHRINGQLVADHALAIQDADARLDRASLGLRNREIACKRDWCFALYPAEQLHRLRAAVEHGMGK